jgi:hypothetical protein
LSTALESIATYIPTEVLGAYIPIFALVSSTPLSGLKWLLFAVFLVATPVVVWITFAIQVAKGGSGPPLNPAKWPVWAMLAAVLAFVAYAAALPGSVFHSIPGYNDAYGGVAVLLTAFVLALGNELAKVLNRAD